MDHREPTTLRTAARGLGALLLRSAGVLIAAAFGVAWFAHWAGWKVLDPTHVSWLMTGEDWHQHLVGWWFFRNEPWHLPLGRMDGLAHPVGTNIGFTDTTPWVAITLKLVSPLLPRDFQFIGPWLGLCFAALGATGAWIARRHGAGIAAQVGAGVMLAATPIMMARVGHESLTAHFLLVTVIALHFAPVRREADLRRWIISAWVAVVIASGVHPYLAAMVTGVAVALPWTLTLLRTKEGAPHLRVPMAALASLVIAVTPAAVFALIGYFSGSSTTDAGFGYFNADVVALVNPLGMSRVIPDLPASRPHKEGYGFIGLGGFWIVSVVLVIALIRFKAVLGLTWRRLIPLMIVVAVATLYAFSTKIEFGQQTLVDLTRLYSRLEWLTGTFRGSGRFIWVAHYTLLVGALLLTVSLLNGRPVILAGILLVAGALQAADLKYGASFLFQRRPGPSSIVAPLWKQLGGEYRHLAMVPAQIYYAGAPCGGQFPGHLMYELATVAYRERMTFNGGLVARAGAPMREYCGAILEAFTKGELDPDTAYVVSPQVMSRLNASARSHVCARVDGLFLCVNGERETSVRSQLQGTAR